MKKTAVFVIIFLMVFAINSYPAGKYHETSRKAKTEQGPKRNKRVGRTPRSSVKKRLHKAPISRKNRGIKTNMLKL
jgi:hypothetical protein